MTSSTTPGPRPLSPRQKLAALTSMWHTARALKTAALRAAHPSWTDAEIRVEVRRILMRDVR